MMTVMRTILLTVALGGRLLAADLDPRLTVHTYVREDIFAGFMANDMDRFTKGERKLEQMLAERPAEKSTTLAWMAGAAFYRASVANREGKTEESGKLVEKAMAIFAEGQKANPRDGGMYAVMGGTLVLFADKVPEQFRSAAWEKAYMCYQALGKQQMAGLNTLPLHIKGELLAWPGLRRARSARAAIRN